MSDSAVIGTKQIELGRRKLTISRPNLETEFRYSQYLEERALAAVRRNARALADVSRVQAEVVKDITAGDYGWGGDLFARSLKRRDHAEELLFLCIFQSDQSISREILHKFMEDGVATGASEKAFDALFELVYSPNFTAPADQAGAKS